MGTDAAELVPTLPLPLNDITVCMHITGSIFSDPVYMFKLGYRVMG